MRRTDGRSLAVEAADPIGSPAKPLSDAALAAKFRDCAQNARRPPSEAQVAAALDLIARPEAASDATELLMPFAG